jgi:hypothetical protein
MEAIRGHMADYNAANRAQLDLVLCGYAADHILRISRIIQQPHGHALLVRPLYPCNMQTLNLQSVSNFSSISEIRWRIVIATWGWSYFNISLL